MLDLSIAMRYILEIEEGESGMTRKEYRELLNKRYPFNPSDVGKGDRNQYKARKRAYGDYLWFNDRSMFEADYQEELKKAAA